MSNFLPSPDRLHHAYIITASKLEQIKSDIEKYVTERLGLPFHGNPDVFVGEYANMGIDDFSDITSMHQRVAIGPKKIIIILANNLTVQAQNSILKMIEEPTPHTHFFIGLPTASTLLPTVLSRVHVVELESENGEKVDPRVKEFISSSLPERLEMVKEFMTDLDKERVTKEEIFRFISSILAAVHEKDKKPDTLTVLARVSDYLRDPSASLKMIFEYLALRLP